MKQIILIFSFLLINPVQYSYADTIEKYKKKFMEFCTNKQSNSFCQCTFDGAFVPTFRNIEKIKERKITSRRESVINSLEMSLRDDSNLTKERLDKLCDMADKYAEETENYYFKIYGEKEPRYVVDYEHKKQIANIEKRISKEISKLHDEFMTNKITRRNFKVDRSGYCLQRNFLIKDEANYEKSKKEDIIINYNAVFSSGIKLPECRKFFKR